MNNKLLILMLFAIYLLSFKHKEHFNVLDDVKGFAAKIENIGNDIKNLPNKIKKDVVDPAIKPIKEFITMVNNIRLESR